MLVMPEPAPPPAGENGFGGKQQVRIDVRLGAIARAGREERMG
jgi:hypothetical protein